MLFRVDCANPCREKAQLTGVCTEGFQRAIADFVRFHCPFVASAEAKSLRYSAFTSAFTSANWLSTSDSFTTDDGE